MGKPRTPKPFLARDREPPTPRDRSVVQEQRLASEMGLRLSPNSGATAHQKGDARSAVFRFEMKLTGKASARIEAGVLTKIWHEAAETGHVPAVVVTLSALEHPIESDWVLITKTDFDAMRRGQLIEE